MVGWESNHVFSLSVRLRLVIFDTEVGSAKRDVRLKKKIIRRKEKNFTILDALILGSPVRINQLTLTFYFAKNNRKLKHALRVIKYI